MYLPWSNVIKVIPSAHMSFICVFVFVLWVELLIMSIGMLMLLFRAYGDRYPLVPPLVCIWISSVPNPKSDNFI